MKRFNGLMPTNEIQIEKKYMCKGGDYITIQAGEHGWTVIWPDNSTTYNDEDHSTDENFSKACNVATKRVGRLTEVTNKGRILTEE